jgi:putative acetyltransferase
VTIRHFIPLCLVVLASCGPKQRGSSDTGVDRTVSGNSKYPIAVDVAKVGTYPALVKSGAGYFYDDVLEYRVWLHPEKGAERQTGGDDYFLSFAQFERALEFSKKTAGAEEPLALIRQMKHINEPSPGVFEIVEGERIAEWQVPWLVGTKRTTGALERFLREHMKPKLGEQDSAANGSQPIRSETNRTPAAAGSRR